MRIFYQNETIKKAHKQKMIFRQKKAPEDVKQ